jgi:hypothetical protein
MNEVIIEENSSNTTTTPTVTRTSQEVLKNFADAEQQFENSQQ